MTTVSRHGSVHVYTSTEYHSSSRITTVEPSNMNILGTKLFVLTSEVYFKQGK